VSFINGPSIFKCVVIGLIPTLPANSLLFPSFDSISRTEDILPPYLLGIPPLYRVTSFIISELTDEKNPKKWVELYTGAPYSSIRF
jgi:hypothetical protein